LMNTDSPPPIFEVIFEGEQLYPEEITLRTLSDALSAIQRLAMGHKSLVVEEGEEDEEEEQEGETKDDSLRLVGIERGSAIYRVAGPPPAPVLIHLRSVGQLLSNPEDVEAQDDYMLSPLEKLSGVARRLACTITMREPGDRGAILARVEPKSYETISKTLLVAGETSLIGRVMRVGGATALRCGLRVPFQQRLLICRVESSAIAREIGERLYQDVVVNGDAVWLKNSWRLYSFTIRGVQQPVQGSIVEAIEALREAGGKDWDAVEDPMSYLDEVNTDR
jgi:hypothetical protein